MTYQELIDKLSKLSPEHLKRQVILYDTMSGHLYNPKETIYIDQDDELINLARLSSTEKFDALDLPIYDCDAVIISF